MKAIPQPVEEQRRVLRQFPGSPVWIAQHNSLLGRIEELRTTLEKIEPEGLARAQGAIAEVRRMLAGLHEHDSESIKNIYA